MPSPLTLNTKAEGPRASTKQDKTGEKMPSLLAKDTQERAGKSMPGAGLGKERRKEAAVMERPKPGWALTLERLAAMPLIQRRRHLLFGDWLEDVGEAASIFPRESVELAYCMPDPRAWTQSLEQPGERQNQLLGVLKAAEARARVRALRLRYIRMRVSPRPKDEQNRVKKTLSLRERVDGGTQLARGKASLSLPGPQAEEITFLIQQQGSARAAIRLELFLPPRLKPARIPDPLDRLERRRVETILEESVDGNIFWR